MNNCPISRKEENASIQLKIPRMPVAERITTFEEVEQGLTEEQAIQEAGRCLNCKNAPCVTACPVKVSIPDFISVLVEGDLPRAAHLLRRANPFSAVCGRICSQEQQCESKCILRFQGAPIAIGALERFVADWALENADKSGTEFLHASTGKNVAVIGGGLAGLSAAADLAIRGHQVKIYEAQHDIGGVLLFGIPEFRLPWKIVSGEIARILSLGVRLECNAPVGKMVSFNRLYAEYDAVFLANGAGSTVSPGIPGEGMCGVFSARDFLANANKVKSGHEAYDSQPLIHGKKVAVIGGGNTAMDCARVALRLGADRVTVVYRRGESDMPARVKEIALAKEEGVRVLTLLSPVEVLGDEACRVKGLLCQQMKSGETDSSGRCIPVPMPDAFHEVETDMIIYALGAFLNPVMADLFPEQERGGNNTIVVHSNGSTNIPRVFIGGDTIRKCGTAAVAIADGKRAAAAIHSFLATAAP